jgi:opacity protein-like surface antigen
MKRLFSFLLLLLLSTLAGAQEEVLNANADSQHLRTQYPSFLSNSYVSVSAGYITYPFSNLNLEAGYRADVIAIPHVGVRLVLFGHRFNKYLSGQITYMRPVLWVNYKDVNGSRHDNTVWMNVAGLTVKPQGPLAKNLSVFGEGGLGIVTRKGFTIDSHTVIADANYASFLYGAGLEYRVNNKWDLLLTAAYSPAKSNVKQPYTLYVGVGFNYKFHPLPAERVRRNAAAGYFFPKNLPQVGYATNALGYGVNDFFAGKTLPVFWGGDAHVKQGVSVRYQRNLFHTLKVFSLDLGGSLAYWKSRYEQVSFYTFSVYPMFRFTAMRTKPADLYFMYSVAGPTFISKTRIDGNETGRHFTFQDMMGMGVLAGKSRRLNAEINIGHYSNGNLFPENAGVKIPLTFNVGWAF